MIENLPHLKPILWGAFSPNPHKSLTSQDQKNIVAGLVNNIKNMAPKEHYFPFFVEFPDNLDDFQPKLHGHFVINATGKIPGKIYRAARRKTYGYFMLKQYDPSKYGIVYMYQNHQEVRFDDIFCRNGAGCRKKRIHTEFLEALNNMYRHW